MSISPSSPVMGRMVTEKAFVAEFHRTVAGYPELTRVYLEQEATHIKVRLYTPDLERTKMYTVLPNGTIPNLSSDNLTLGEMGDRELILDALVLRKRLNKALADEQSTHQDRFEKLQRTEMAAKS